MHDGPCEDSEDLAAVTKEFCAKLGFGEPPKRGAFYVGFFTAALAEYQAVEGFV